MRIIYFLTVATILSFLVLNLTACGDAEFSPCLSLTKKDSAGNPAYYVDCGEKK